MDHNRFDDLTRTLATTTSRRQFLKTIAATTLAGLLGLSGIDTAFAKPKCHRAGLGCNTNSKCCSNLCCNGVCCATGQTCFNGSCCSLTPNGGICSLGSDCCSGICDMTANTCVSCIPAPDEICFSNNDCCAGLVCVSGHCLAPS